MRRHPRGNFDPLRALELYPGAEPYGLPYVGSNSAAAPDRLASYTAWRQLANRGSDRPPGTTGVHFFLDDYRFESVWNDPDRADRYLGTADSILTPDFSMFSDWPLSLQIWNAYRSRWLGARWERMGRVVVPTLNWSTPDTTRWAFTGILRGSVVAVSTVGLGTDRASIKLFCDGYLEALHQVNPPLVLSVSERFPDEVRYAAPLVTYKPFQVSMAQRAR